MENGGIEGSVVLTRRRDGVIAGRGCTECNLKRVTWGVTTTTRCSRYSRLPTQSSYWDKEYSTRARRAVEISLSLYVCVCVCLYLYLLLFLSSFVFLHLAHVYDYLLDVIVYAYISTFRYDAVEFARLNNWRRIGRIVFVG